MAICNIGSQLKTQNCRNRILVIYLRTLAIFITISILNPLTRVIPAEIAAETIVK